jgi:hypothetical protein
MMILLAWLMRGCRGLLWQAIMTPASIGKSLPRIARELHAGKLRKANSVQAKLYREAFEATPHPYAFLTPNMKFVGANPAYLATTMTRQTGLQGRDRFEVFPDNPERREANGVRNIRESFNRVLSSNCLDIIPLQRHDIRRPNQIFQ